MEGIREEKFSYIEKEVMPKGLFGLSSMEGVLKCTQRSRIIMGAQAERRLRFPGHLRA